MPHHHVPTSCSGGACFSLPSLGGLMAYLKLPKGAIKPRPAVLAMAPYSPPTGGRAGNLRLDFNENTVGCSPKVIEFLKANLSASDLAVYPEYTAAKEAIARYFHVAPEQFVFTNGTDEALQAGPWGCPGSGSPPGV